MKKFLYSSHLGGLFWNDDKIDDEYLYCEECGDYDEYLGEASNIEEAKALIDKVSHPYRDDEDADEEDREFCQYTDEHIKELLEEFEFKPSTKSPDRMESKIDETVREINSGMLNFNTEFINNPEKMKELGFYDAGEYWLYNKFLPIKDKKYKGCEFSFYFEIYKKDTVEKSSLCILDEDFCQPYPYEKCAADDLYNELNNGVIDYINKLVNDNVLIPDEAYAMGAKRTL